MIYGRLYTFLDILYKEIPTIIITCTPISSDIQRSQFEDTFSFLINKEFYEDLFTR